MTDPDSVHTDTLVRHFRQILLWPLQLMPIREGAQIQKHWELLQTPDPENHWKEVADEFTGESRPFEERRYTELVTFLPYIQRLLYGEGTGTGTGLNQESPIRVFHRRDAAKVRLTYPDHGVVPLTFEVADVELYFFYDIDVIILSVEVHADDIPLARAQETMYRFGRGYPTYWEPSGRGGHCLEQVEWLSSDGKVLAVSDYEKRDRYLSFAQRYRAPCIASHWEWLLEPLVLHHSGKKGLIRYRQIEHHLMPLMAYLAVDDPCALTRADFIRLGLASGPATSGSLPFSEHHLRDFEDRYCYDRYWEGHDRTRSGARFMCSGRVFTIVGDRGERFVIDRKTGLDQFRHEYFLLFLISHFYKAALLMLLDRLLDAMNKLDISKPTSVRQFRRVIRKTLEIFLRFTHRYWFHEVSDHVHAKELFRMIGQHLGTDRLYAEVREAIEDMSRYHDSDLLRRQGETMVRLTVVATLGLVGVTTTAFFGMNLISVADSPLLTKIGYFLMVFIPTVALTAYTVLKSRRLADFLETLADERRSSRAKLAALVDVWKTKAGPHP
jgi:hypothetical protein